jgi:hypothetical protein
MTFSVFHESDEETRESSVARGKHEEDVAKARRSFQ